VITYIVIHVFRGDDKQLLEEFALKIEFASNLDEVVRKAI